MPEPPSPEDTRRTFLKKTAAAAAIMSFVDWRTRLAAADAPSGASASSAVPWYRRGLRWGQTNLTEIDPTRIDIPWWRAHWKRTRIQGVVVNAGGIVAYYPTDVPLHRRAEFLGDRDLFGELVHAAHEDGLAVFARMDSNRADKTFYQAHPDWFAHDADGQPYRANDLFIACVNSPYYAGHIPAILREVATRYHPEGFTDNSWSGPTRHQPCFCTNCERSFRARTGAALPRTANWNDPLYREWILWNYARRIEIWDTFNRITREAGGADCLWVGMMAGSQNWQARVFRDDREIYRRTELVMLDHQRRFDGEGFQSNADTGQRIRSVGGWDKVIPESMAMYQLADHNFRLASKPEPEARMWVLEGFAGGVQPWWHHVGAVQEDRRMLHTAEPLWRWHEAHAEFLINRRPVATVGLVWSQRNMDFFGRDDSGALVSDPWNGWMQALVRARIPYVPVHVDDVPRLTGELGLRLLLLPNVAAMTDAQSAAVRTFVSQGGNLLATGLTSLCNEWGEARADHALADLFGVHVPASHSWRDDVKRATQAKAWAHTYLRLPDGDARHDVLRGFDETNLLAFGGVLEPLTVEADTIVPLTFVPALPTSPPEEVWMREPKTDIPGLVLRTGKNDARIAYLAADLDRRFSRDNLPDHGDLLANVVRWTAHDDIPLQVDGRGLIDCRLYHQSGRLVLHVVNLTSAGTWRTPVHELIPIGPLQIRVRPPDDVAGTTVRSLVTGTSLPTTVRDGWCGFRIDTLMDHDVLVVT